MLVFGGVTLTHLFRKMPWHPVSICSKSAQVLASRLTRAREHGLWEGWGNLAAKLRRFGGCDVDFLPFFRIHFHLVGHEEYLPSFCNPKNNEARSAPKIIFSKEKRVDKAQNFCGFLTTKGRMEESLGKSLALSCSAKEKIETNLRTTEISCVFWFFGRVNPFLLPRWSKQSLVQNWVQNKDLKNPQNWIKSSKSIRFK